MRHLIHRNAALASVLALAAIACSATHESAGSFASRDIGEKAPSTVPVDSERHADPAPGAIRGGVSHADCPLATRKTEAEGVPTTPAILSACTQAWFLTLPVAPTALVAPTSVALTAEGHLEVLIVVLVPVAPGSQNMVTGYRLLEIDTDGGILSDRTLGPIGTGMLVELAKLDVIGGVLGPFAIQNHAVAVVDSEHTFVVDCDGVTRWDVPMGGSVARFGLADDVYIGGSYAVINFGSPTHRWIVTKLAATKGARLWTTQIEDPQDHPPQVATNYTLSGMVVEANDNVDVVASQRRSSEEGTFWVNVGAKLDSDGNILWSHPHGAIGDQASIALAVDAAGRRTEAESFQPQSQRRGPIYLTVTQSGSDGTGGWSFSAHGVHPTVAVDADGTAFVSVIGGSNSNDDQFPGGTFALSLNGTLMWQSPIEASAIVTDGSGGVYFGGWSWITKYEHCIF
jgi:hypothetical protein